MAVRNILQINHVITTFSFGNDNHFFMILHFLADRAIHK